MKKTSTRAANASAGQGYSATPLYRKLGIKSGQHVWLINSPDEYPEWLAGLPEGVELGKRRSRQTQLVHLFATRQSQLRNKLPQLRNNLQPQVPVWVSWPKKSSGVSSDITEDTIRQVALPLGFVDIKVCAVNEVWSALKLVVRRELR